MSKSKSKSKSKPVDRAEPTIKLPMITDAQKIDVTHSTTAAMPKSPLWAASADVQSATKTWNQAATDLDSNAQTIADLRHQLSVAEGKQRSLRRIWRVAKRQVLASVSLVCAGSADDVKGFSFEVVMRTPSGPLATPDGLVTAPGALMGQATVKWHRGFARHGFLVQHATDPTNAATYSVAVPCTKVTYTLSGLAPSGSSVSFRVAAIDPNAPQGQSPWSGWVAATVR